MILLFFFFFLLFFCLLVLNFGSLTINLVTFALDQLSKLILLLLLLFNSCISFSYFFSLDRCSISSREVSILWSYLDITLLFSSYVYLIFLSFYLPFLLYFYCILILYFYYKMKIANNRRKIR